MIELKNRTNKGEYLPQIYALSESEATSTTASAER